MNKTMKSNLILSDVSKGFTMNDQSQMDKSRISTVRRGGGLLPYLAGSFTSVSPSQ